MLVTLEDFRDMNGAGLPPAGLRCLIRSCTFAKETVVGFDYQDRLANQRRIHFQAERKYLPSFAGSVRDGTEASIERLSVSGFESLFASGLGAHTTLEFLIQ